MGQPTTNRPMCKKSRTMHRPSLGIDSKTSKSQARGAVERRDGRTTPTLELRRSRTNRTAARDRPVTRAERAKGA